MLDLVKIGQTITTLRMNAEMTQQELADSLYVTHQAVSKWENGKSIPTIDIMYELTKLFHVTIDDLISTDELDDEFTSLLSRFPRDHCINQLIKGKIQNVHLDEVLYLLSPKERQIILHHLISQNESIDIENLLPYLNQLERRKILEAVLTKKIKANVIDFYFLLTKQERKMFEKEMPYEY